MGKAATQVKSMRILVKKIQKTMTNMKTIANLNWTTYSHKIHS